MNKKIKPEKAEKKWTHSELCDIAVRWLKKTHSAGGPGCSMAVSEVKSGYDGEIPDAIGFRYAGHYDGSYMVECKASRSDFLADFKKAHRSEPLGNFRYFLAPEGIIQVHELPQGWGLLEVTPRGSVKAIVGSVVTANDHLNYDVESEGNYDFQKAWEARKAAVEAWRQAGNPTREQYLLVKLFSKIGDHDKSNKIMKETLNRFNRICSAYEETMAEVRQLRDQVSSYRWAAESLLKDGKPIPPPKETKEYSSSPLSQALEEFLNEHKIEKKEPNMKATPRKKLRRGW